MWLIASVQCGGCGERVWGAPEGKGMMDLAGFGLVLPLLPWKVLEQRVVNGFSPTVKLLLLALTPSCNGTLLHFLQRPNFALQMH